MIIEEDYEMYNLTSSDDDDELEYEEKKFYELNLKVGSLTILQDSIQNHVGESSYYIACWIEPEHVTKTNEFTRDLLGNITFRGAWTLRMYDPMNMDPYLKLEVVRVCSGGDVGSSKGENVVGRTKVALPRLMNRVAEGILKLARLSENGTCENSGSIALNMELKINTVKFRKYKHWSSKFE